MATHIRNWTWEINQLATGLLEVERAVVPMDHCVIGSVVANRAALHRVRLAAGWAGALLPAPESGKVFIEGWNLDAGMAVLLPSSVEVELLTHGIARLFVVAYRDGTTEAAESIRGSFRRASIARAAGLLDDLPGSLATPNATFAETQALGALQTRLVGWLRAAAARAMDPCADRRDLPRRRLAVERARRYIHEHLAEPIRLPELCRHAHIQARSLEYGFRDLVGMSPIRYVKMLRLGEVRRRLQASSPGERSVSEVALDCGFFHLSQFAVDYKKVFLESPSATRRADAAAWPANARFTRAGRAPAPAQCSL